MKISRPRSKTLAAVVGLLMLAAPLAACGSSDSTHRVKAVATVNDLSAHGGMTEVLLSKDFAGALQTLKLKPSPFGTGKITTSSPNGTLEFPITGGWVQLFKPGTVPNYVVGQVQHEGSGVTLTAGKTAVTIGNFNVDPGRSIVYGDVVLNGKPAAQDVPIFDLNGSTLQPIKPTSSQVVLYGTKVFIDPVAVKLLNQVFHTSAVTSSLEVGVARITVDLS